MNSYYFRSVCPVHGYELFTVNAIADPVPPTCCKEDTKTQLTDSTGTGMRPVNAAILNDNMEGLIADVHSEIVKIQAQIELLQSKLQ